MKFEAHACGRPGQGLKIACCTSTAEAAGECSWRCGLRAQRQQRKETARLCAHALPPSAPAHLRLQAGHVCGADVGRVADHPGQLGHPRRLQWLKPAALQAEQGSTGGWRAVAALAPDSADSIMAVQQPAWQALARKARAEPCLERRDALPHAQPARIESRIRQRHWAQVNCVHLHSARQGRGRTGSEGAAANSGRTGQQTMDKARDGGCGGTAARLWAVAYRQAAREARAPPRPPVAPAAAPAPPPPPAPRCPSPGLPRRRGPARGRRPPPPAQNR